MALQCAKTCKTYNESICRCIHQPFVSDPDRLEEAAFCSTKTYLLQPKSSALNSKASNSQAHQTIQAPRAATTSPIRPDRSSNTQLVDMGCIHSTGLPTFGATGLWSCRLHTLISFAMALTKKSCIQLFPSRICFQISSLKTIFACGSTTLEPEGVGHVHFLLHFVCGFNHSSCSSPI